MRQSLKQQAQSLISGIRDGELNGKLTIAFNNAKELFRQIEALPRELIGEDYSVSPTATGGLRVDIKYKSQFRGSFRPESERCVTVEGNEISATTGWSDVKTTAANIDPAIAALKGFRQRLRQSLSGGAR